MFTLAHSFDVQITDLNSFRNKIYLTLATIIVTLLLPLTAYSLYLENVPLVFLFTLSTIMLCADLYAYKARQTFIIPPYLLVAPLAIACILAVSEMGATGVFWCYPVLFLCFLLLERNIANIMIFLFVAALGVLNYNNLDPAASFLALISIGLFTLIANILLSYSTRLLNQLQSESITDPLTGALNRRMLDQSLNECISRKERYHTSSALISVDLDNFKTINDRYGHLKGDTVLKTLVAIIRSRTRRLDQVFRTGGDEFLIVLPDTSELNAKSLARELTQLVKEDTTMASYHSGISMGVCELAQDDTATDWIERCDQAMYRSKSRKNNKFLRKMVS